MKASAARTGFFGKYGKWIAAAGICSAIAAAVWFRTRPQPAVEQERDLVAELPAVQQAFKTEFLPVFESLLPGIDPQGFDAMNWIQVGKKYLTDEELVASSKVLAKMATAFESPELCARFILKNSSLTPEQHLKSYLVLSPEEIQMQSRWDAAAVKRLVEAQRAGRPLPPRPFKYAADFQKAVLRYASALPKAQADLVGKIYGGRNLETGNAQVTAKEVCEGFQVFNGQLDRIPHARAGELLRYIYGDQNLLSKIPGAPDEPIRKTSATTAAGSGH